MSASETKIGELKLIGGRLCLDFINTADEHASHHPEEYLTSYAALVAWSRHVEIMSEEEAQQLLAEAQQRPDEAAETLAAAISLREALFRIFRAALEGKLPASADLAIFNDARADALAYSQIIATADGFAWRWLATGQNLGWMLWPVVRSAEDLLLSPDLKLVKECPGPDCGWFFLDTSKNHTRRWCTMDSCGNRAKFRRHYQRKRQHQQADG
jgi:predicted RNA-binding Zn ribbon-like protein